MSYYSQNPPPPPPPNMYNPNSGFPAQDYLKNVSPEMINIGLNAGQDILNKQRDKWMPGVSGFWSTLKYYFSVNNNYVLKKIAMILYPLQNKSTWGRLSADEFERGELDEVSHKFALPKNDLNAPDLYIPTMAFVTYVLLYAFYRGLGTTTSTFSPEIIIQVIWKCLFLQCMEALALKLGSNVLSVPIAFLDTFSYSGYKYVALCINSLARLLHGTLNVIISLYTAGMLAYFVLKTVAAAIPPPAGATSNPTRLAVLLGFAGIQFILVLFMSLF